MGTRLQQRLQEEEQALERHATSSRRVRRQHQAAGETGGPGESWLPSEDDPAEPQELYPTDLIREEPGPDGVPVRTVTPIGCEELEDSRKLLTGWSVARQRLFLEHLAETGSVHAAAGEARLSARSAYRLRARSPAFARAWDLAQQLAVGRLSALAFDRAINGALEQRFVDGQLSAEIRRPSDKMLMWLLARLDPKRFALPWERRSDEAADPQGEALAAFPDQLEALTDLSTTPYAPAPAEQPAEQPAAPAPAPAQPAPRTWGCHVVPPLATGATGLGLQRPTPTLRTLGPFAPPEPPQGGENRGSRRAEAAVARRSGGS
jgi:hypothetical protein